MTSEQNTLQVCHETICPKVAFKKAPFISRRAVDDRGKVGSFYDAHRDEIGVGLCVPMRSQVLKEKKRISASLGNRVTMEIPNIAAQQKMNEELRISLLLNLTKAERMGALVNHIEPVNEYTRVLVYVNIQRTEYLADQEFENMRMNKKKLDQYQGTHVIVLVNYGINATVILQLPEDESRAKNIDLILEEVPKRLRQNLDIENEEYLNILRSIPKVTVYSNVIALARCKSLPEFFKLVKSTLLKKETEIPPYNYSLCPIEELFLTNTVPPELYEIHYLTRLEFEAYLLEVNVKFQRIRNQIRLVRIPFEKYCQKRYRQLEKDCDELLLRKNQIYQKLQQSVLNMRRNGPESNIKFPLINNPVCEQLRQDINQLHEQVLNMDHKEKLIENIVRTNMAYCDVTQYEFQKEEAQTVLRKDLIKENIPTAIMCSSDTLCQSFPERFNLIIHDLQDEAKKSELKVIYADFSYSEVCLNSFQVLRSDGNDFQDTEHDIRALKTSTKISTKQIHRNETINILLLGESGVGKSTFINALANYLQYSSFDVAREKEPIVLLPISFILTSGHDFHQHHVQYDGLDEISNENFGKVGHSVTQSCKSYLMTVTGGKFQGQTLRFIDTPGFDDTHDVDQYECNRHDILSFIDNLSHLNAICFVMKSNSNRVKVAFSLFMRQIFDVMGERVRDHVLFCFTNTRTTFCAPGDTSPVLREILQSIPGDSIPYGKSTIFCLDNGGFRYLAAKKRGVPFEKDEEEEYRNSWRRSSDEVDRLLTSILQKETVYDVKQNHPSIQRTRLKIEILLRPLLHSFQNIYRNSILKACGRKNESISLRAKSCERLQGVMTQRELNISSCGQFFINDEIVSSKYEIKNLRQLAFHEVRFQLTKTKSDDSISDMKEFKKNIINALCSFGVFLESTGSNDNDVILLALQNILEIEQSIVGRKKKAAEMNGLLIKELKDFILTYLDSKDNEKFGETFDLSNIDEHLQFVNELPSVKRQVDAISETKRKIFEKSEFKWKTSVDS